MRLLMAFGIGLPVLFGVALSVATLQVDRYRPFVVQYLETAIGAPVQLDRLTVGWRGGLAIQLHGLAVEDAPAASAPILTLESASAIVRVLPLFTRVVSVSSVVLTRPRVYVKRNAQGHIEWQGLAVGALAAGQRAVVEHPITPATMPSGPWRVPDNTPLSFNVASLRIEDGLVRWTDALTTPPTEITLARLDVSVKPIVAGTPMDITLTGALNHDRQNLHLAARLTLPQPAQAGALEAVALTLERVALESLLPPVPDGEPQLHGTLSTTIQGRATLGALEELIHSTTGSGTLTLETPVITNLNVLRSLFEKLAVIPGLVEKLEQRLPPEYDELLSATDTTLSPLTISLEVHNGVLRFNELNVRTAVFGVSGAGQVSLQGAIDVSAILRINPTCSAALIRSVQELQALVNATGEIETPVTLHGQLPRVALVPGMNDIASRILVTKFQDLLGSFIERAIE